MKNRVELRDYIRYQLAQLGARNGEHEFELLAFELARLRHVSNLVPATGPVKAGGDQGRDFESYHTYLSQTSIAANAFASLISTEIVVGACTLDKKTPTKIRADLKTIFGSGERPQKVYYFCEPNVVVSTRHKLIAECKAQFDASLVIFDGLAIADQLSDTDTFWIAEQYLSVPSEFFPQESDSDYAALRDRWLAVKRPAESLADFLDIKMGLRTATHEEYAKPDIIKWLARMKDYASEPNSNRMKQKARYEVSVAELKGRGNLDPAIDYIRAFFADFPVTALTANDLLDGAIVVAFCQGSITTQQSSLTRREVEGFANVVEAVLARKLTEIAKGGDYCTLLEAKAMLTVVVRKDRPAKANQVPMVQAWLEVITAVKDVPYYPISHIAMLIEKLAPILIEVPEFTKLRDEVDRLSHARAGKRSIAEISRKRALAHLNAGQRLAAIDELQKAKVGAFTGEELPLSILIMLMLSQCYSELGLHFAARYYAAGATFMTMKSADENVYQMLPQAAFALAETFYSAGEGTTYFLQLGHAFQAHVELASEPAETGNHPYIERAFAHAGIFKVVADKLVPDLNSTLADAVQAWPFAAKDVYRFLDMATSASAPWPKMTVDELEVAFERDLGCTPFTDLGDAREVTWMALGIRWTVRFLADEVTLPTVQGLIATLQVAQAELTSVELLIVPSSALIVVDTMAVGKMTVEYVGDNNILTWRVSIPDRVDDDEDMLDAVGNAVAMVVTVIGQSSALDIETYQQRIHASLDRGLLVRVFSVRPAHELMSFALQQAPGWQTLIGVSKYHPKREIEPIEAPEMRWRTGDGPGYTKEKANEALSNRYRRSVEMIRYTLPKLAADRGFRANIATLKAEGVLDWQILIALMNLVTRLQVEAHLGGPITWATRHKHLDRLKRPEELSDAVVSPDTLTIKLLNEELERQPIYVAGTWGLTLPTDTPIMKGIKRLLDVRYGNSRDDIPHNDLFGLSTENGV
ncbi:hypothetical protein [Asticcacaulis endophyticus]|uniref:Uncharacterized protein n=1 Tax=Asticcacaulis endophyticus TaxID=1395890 RepID=A0A918Q5S8_9CAUL|nr:hypothetical protein [Asticcacaulis endophyticus]GGZ32918.1 hypothetical protein GCM10011273_19000 [Asticcacaulis endophyticus]